MNKTFKEIMGEVPEGISTSALEMLKAKFFPLQVEEEFQAFRITYGTPGNEIAQMITKALLHHVDDVDLLVKDVINRFEHTNAEKIVKDLVDATTMEGHNFRGAWIGANILVKQDNPIVLMHPIDYTLAMRGDEVLHRGNTDDNI